MRQRTIQRDEIMKTGNSILAAGALAFAAISTPSLAHDANMMGGQHQTNQGMMASPGHMTMGQMPMSGHGSMMPGMMQHMHQHHGGHNMGMSSGMPGGGYGIKAERELDVEALTKVLTGRLAWTGNPRLKVGKVVEKDDDTIIAEIITLDGSLVDRLAVHRRTGAMRRLP